MSNELFEFDCIDFLTEFCLNEIALQGLEGCEISGLFELFFKSSNSLYVSQVENSNLEIEKIYKIFSTIHERDRESIDSVLHTKNFIWKILINQYELDFYIQKSNNETNSTQNKNTKAKTNAFRSLVLSRTTQTKLSHIISDNQTRGFCKTYYERKCVNSSIKANEFTDFAIRSFQDCLKEFGSSLIVVANQQLRNKVLSPSNKCLDFENLNPLEYCVLENIAKSRYEGVSSIGENGLTQLFDLASKQLHYILNILESNDLIKKQVSASEKKRSLIHLSRYACKRKSLLELICDYLVFKHEVKKTGYEDTAANIRQKIGISNKQLKSLIQLAERQNILKRFIALKERKPTSGKQLSKKKMKPMQIRMIKLTDSYFNKLKISRQGNTMDEVDNEFDDDELGDDNLGDDELNLNQINKSSIQTPYTDLPLDLVETLGMAQSNLIPLYTQLFAQIEASGKEGISLKQLGTMFGFDFYKSRRMGHNLQMHPDIVTIIKETNRGKAKYQTIVLRKFIQQQQQQQQLTNEFNSSNRMNIKLEEIEQPQTSSSLLAAASSSFDSNDVIISSEIQNLEPEIMIIKRDINRSKSGSSTHTNNIQALIANRSVTRKKIIFDYLDKHRICTKYEINREIRNREAEQGLKGSIDSKTTKRMLQALEKENKLKIFEVELKNVSYMCVRSIDLSEDDEIYKNYCQTFKRTFDSVDLKVKQELKETNNSSYLNESNLDESNNNSKNRSFENSLNNTSIDKDSEILQFELNQNYTDSIVNKLVFSLKSAKNYGSVPKVQKSIVLYRYLSYLLFFYDGSEQSESAIPSKSELDASSNPSFNKEDTDLVNMISFPSANKTFKPYDLKNPASWKTFIPPLDRKRANSSKENCCVFVGEMLSHMPLSIFCALVVINYEIPGLLALLKHPQKRHILVKDLPPQLIAPLIYKRRYIRRIMANLQFLVTLGLVSFLESPCKANEAVNRDAQSQAVYVFRKAAFYDTSVNKCQNWNELVELNKLNFEAQTQTESNKKFIKYSKKEFEFNSDEDIVDYWSRLVHISMNTYKFTVGNYLKWDKKLKRKLQTFVNRRNKLKDLDEMWPIEDPDFSDHMGPGGYDSQLFLHFYQNWIITSNIDSNLNSTNNTRSKSANKSKAITKDDDQSYAPMCELALPFPYDIFRGLNNINNQEGNEEKKKSKKKAKKRKSDLSDTEDDDEDFILSDSEDSENESIKRSKPKKMKMSKSKPKLNIKLKSLQKPIENRLKLKKAKNLIEKAKIVSNRINSSTSTAMKTANITKTKDAPNKPSDNNNNNNNRTNQISKSIWNDRRAIWHTDEDELLLIIRVASIYLMPGERCVPFKLISDLMYELMPKTCGDKSVTAIARRVKVLLKVKMNQLFILNKYELCKQDKELNRKYEDKKSQLKRNIIDRECIDLYIEFINDIIERHIKKRNYDNTAETSIFNNQQDKLESEDLIDLPSTMDEFNKKYKINNSSKEILLNNQTFSFQQPTTDYEITFNTLHSAIHSSILINDKNPRVYESFHLFDKYSSQLLADVTTRMSKDHRIIAPTKYSELKKKNITAFSKILGKAYHISQRYQYKWINHISPSVLNETKKFKDKLIDFKLKQNRNASSLNDSKDSIFDCTDKDDLGMTSFLAHTIDNSDIQVQIDVPSSIWVSKHL